jgi:hypothetical protein
VFRGDPVSAVEHCRFGLHTYFPILHHSRHTSTPQSTSVLFINGALLVVRSEPCSRHDLTHFCPKGDTISLAQKILELSFQVQFMESDACKQASSQRDSHRFHSTGKALQQLASISTYQTLRLSAFLTPFVWADFLLIPFQRIVGC